MKRRNRWTVGLAAGLGLAVLAGAARCAGAAPEEFLVGIARSPLDADSLAAVRRAGANSFRRTLEWGAVRRDGRLAVPSEFRDALRIARGLALQPVVVLSYGHGEFDRGGYPKSPAARAAFGDFARFVAGEMGASVRAWEIWNEWNRGTGMPAWAGRGSPGDYARLVESVAPGLRSAAGGRPVWGGGMEGIGRANQWTRRAVAAGLLESIDGVSFHPYSYFLPPRERPPERGLMGFLRELKRRLAIRAQGRTIPLYVTELGWPTHRGPDGVTLAEQANYTARALFLLRADPQVRGAWIYTLDDRPGSDRNLENHFGLRFSDGRPKPVWFTFRDTARLLEGVERCERLNFGWRGRELAGVRLDGPTGKRGVAVWAIDAGRTWRVRLRWRASAELVALSAKTIGSREVLRVPVVARGGWQTAEFPVTDRPVWIEGLPSGVNVNHVSRW